MSWLSQIVEFCRRCRSRNCGSLDVVLTSSVGREGGGRVYYYRCTKCVDVETLDYTRFKRIRRDAVPVLGADPAPRRG